MHDYEQSLKIFRDLKATIDTAFDEGNHNGITSIAKRLKEKGIEIVFIIDVTGLTKEEIEKL